VDRSFQPEIGLPTKICTFQSFNLHVLPLRLRRIKSETGTLLVASQVQRYFFKPACQTPKMMSSVVSSPHFSPENVRNNGSPPSCVAPPISAFFHPETKGPKVFQAQNESENESEDSQFYVQDEHEEFVDLQSGGAHEAVTEYFHPWLPVPFHVPQFTLDFSHFDADAEDADLESIWWDDEDVESEEATVKSAQEALLQRAPAKRHTDHGLKSRRPPSCMVISPLRQVFAHFQLLEKVHEKVHEKAHEKAHEEESTKLRTTVEAKIDDGKLHRHKDTWIWNGNKMTGLRGSTDTPVDHGDDMEVDISSFTPPRRVSPRSSPARTSTHPAPDTLAPSKSHKRKRSATTKHEPNKIRKTRKRQSKAHIRPFDPRYDTYPGTSTFRVHQTFPPASRTHVRIHSQLRLTQDELGGMPRVDTVEVHNAETLLQNARIALLGEVSRELHYLENGRGRKMRLEKMRSAKERLRIFVPGWKDKVREKHKKRRNDISDMDMQMFKHSK